MRLLVKLTNRVFGGSNLKLFLYLVYFCCLAGLSFWLYLTYTNEHALSETVSFMKAKNSVLRQEAQELQTKTDDARGRVETLLAEQKRLESESEKLKLRARELEADWEVVKRCKKDFEEMSSEIDTLKRELSRIRTGSR